MAVTLSRLFRLSALLTWKVSLLQTGAHTAPRPTTVRGNDGRLSPVAMASALTFRWAGTAPYFDKASNSSNCVVNDHPTVAALHVLLERTLALPDTYGTAEQRTRWAAMQKILPPVPVCQPFSASSSPACQLTGVSVCRCLQLLTENGILSTSPYSSYPINNALHNGETPEL